MENFEILTDPIFVGLFNATNKKIIKSSISLFGIKYHAEYNNRFSCVAFNEEEFTII